jgi:hypothetical protein
MVQSNQAIQDQFSDTWHKQANAKLVGKTITKVKWLDPDTAYQAFGWYFQPCEIHLNDGTILTPSKDDEGNDAGSIFTNIKDLPCLPVFHGQVSEKAIQEEEEKTA